MVSFVIYHISRLLTTNWSCVVEGIQADIWGPKRPQRPQRPKRSHYQRSLSASSLWPLWSLRSATVCPFRRFVVCQFVCLSKSPQLRMVPWSLGPEVLKKNMLLSTRVAAYLFSGVRFYRATKREGRALIDALRASNSRFVFSLTMLSALTFISALTSSE